MAEPNPHKKEFTADDLQRYQAGSMPDSERHALEKAALDDPFLADALEGYAFTTTAAADVQELRERLATKANRGKYIPLFRRSGLVRAMGVAALFVLLLGAGWVVYTTSLDTDSQVAMKKSPQENYSPQMHAPPVEIPVTEQNSQADSLSSAPALLSREQKVASGQKSGKKPAAGEQDPQMDAVASGEPAEVDNTRQVLRARPLQKSALNDDTPQAESMEQSAAATATAPSTVFKGRVVDHKNSPVPYATISAGNNAAVVQADKEGFFTVQGQDSTLKASVNALGYEENNLVLQAANDSQKVVLNESRQGLSEVVVVGYGKKNKAARTSRNTMQLSELEPEGGWSSFDAYVEENLKVLQSFGPKKKGEVQLAFEADSVGQPVNIRVQKSLCGSCDEEAIRLLKEGPKWKKKSGKRGRVNIRFAPADK